MGEDVEVKHKVGIPFTMRSEVDGKYGKFECLPGYYNMPLPMARCCCQGAAKKTAVLAKEIH